MTISLRGESPNDQGIVGEVATSAAAVCAAQGMPVGEVYTYAQRGAEYAAQITLIALREIGVIPEEGIDYEKFTTAVQELARITVSSRVSEVSDGRTVSQQALYERVAFGEATRCLGFLINGRKLDQEDIRSRLSRTISLLEYPDEGVPNASYLGSMFELFPCVENETMAEALVRIKARANSVVGVLRALSNGEQVPVKDSAALDGIIFNAYKLTVEGKHFGKVGIQHSADEFRS